MQKSNLNIAFFGTPELTISILEELYVAGYTPKVIVTMPDRAVGRKMIITPPSAKAWGLDHGIPVLQPEKIDATFLEEFSTYHIDLGVVAAYGKILPQALIDLPQHGLINLHYSLLPKYRGATPVESAILKGDKETGVTIQQMEFTLDTGPSILQETLAIEQNETAPSLLERLNEVGKKLVVKAIENIENGSALFTPQQETTDPNTKKIRKEDGELDLAASPTENYRKYLAYFDWPGTYFFVEKEGTKIRVIIKKARFENDEFIIERVVPEGRKEMSYEEFISQK